MKAHLLDSNEPLTEGSDLTAFCGRLVKHAKFKFMLDMSFWEFLESASTFMICPECRSRKFQRTYLYGLVNGQEEMDERNRRYGQVEAA